MKIQSLTEELVRQINVSNRNYLSLVKNFKLTDLPDGTAKSASEVLLHHAEKPHQALGVILKSIRMNRCPFFKISLDPVQRLLNADPDLIVPISLKNNSNQYWRELFAVADQKHHIFRILKQSDITSKKPAVGIITNEAIFNELEMNNWTQLDVCFESLGYMLPAHLNLQQMASMSFQDALKYLEIVFPKIETSKNDDPRKLSKKNKIIKVLQDSQSNQDLQGVQDLQVNQNYQGIQDIQGYKGDSTEISTEDSKIEIELTKPSFRRLSAKKVGGQ